MIKSFLFAVCLMVAMGAGAQSVQKLPIPNTTRGKPLMQVIAERRSSDSFSSRDIDRQTFSEILYVAYGITQDNQHTIHTIAGSKDQEALTVYAFTPKGVFQYVPEYNGVKPLSNKDNRAVVSNQDFVTRAPLTLVYTGYDAQNSPIHAGSALQDVALYATSKGLNSTIGIAFDKQAVRALLNLPEEEKIIVSQTVGWPGN